MSDQVTENLKGMLRDAELKVTHPRVQLLMILSRADHPLSATEIVEHFREDEVDQATVYRNLNSLTDAGIIRQIDLRHSHAHYELAGDDHHHLVCRSCGKVEDFSGCNARSIITTALKQSRQFESVDEHSIELYGLCKGCLG